MLGFPSESDGLWLYRHTLLPPYKNLAFIGAIHTQRHPSVFSVQAAWLADVLRG